MHLVGGGRTPLSELDEVRRSCPNMDTPAYNFVEWTLSGVQLKDAEVVM